MMLASFKEMESMTSSCAPADPNIPEVIETSVTDEKEKSTSETSLPELELQLRSEDDSLKSPGGNSEDTTSSETEGEVAPGSRSHSEAGTVEFGKEDQFLFETEEEGEWEPVMAQRGATEVLHEESDEHERSTDLCSLQNAVVSPIVSPTIVPPRPDSPDESEQLVENDQEPSEIQSPVKEHRDPQAHIPSSPGVLSKIVSDQFPDGNQPVVEEVPYTTKCDLLEKFFCIRPCFVLVERLELSPEQLEMVAAQKKAREEAALEEEQRSRAESIVKRQRLQVKPRSKSTKKTGDGTTLPESVTPRNPGCRTGREGSTRKTPSAVDTKKKENSVPKKPKSGTDTPDKAAEYKGGLNPGKIKKKSYKSPAKLLSELASPDVSVTISKTIEKKKIKNKTKPPNTLVSFEDSQKIMELARQAGIKPLSVYLENLSPVADSSKIIVNQKGTKNASSTRLTVYKPNGEIMSIEVPGAQKSLKMGGRKPVALKQVK